MENKTDQSRYINVKVIEITKHNEKLLSFKLEKPSDYSFKAGQFARLGIIKNNEEVWRAYSPISPEESPYLEFYAILIETGIMSNFFKQMQVGDEIMLWKEANGFLIPELFEDDNKDLVLLSTGSGLAPFLPMLFKEAVWKKFRTITLVHSVSYAKELTYDERLSSLKNDPILSKYQDKFKYQRIVTRESIPETLNKRVTELLETGELEQALNTKFTVEDTRFMLCGNPNMIKSVFATLKNRGFNIHRSKQAGEIIMEHAF